MYDSRLARWSKLDPFAAMYASKSDYSYAIGNPVLNIDVDGNFVIKGTDAEQKRLRTMVDRLKAELFNGTDTYLLDRFKLHSGLSEEEIKWILTDGQGPLLKFSNKLPNSTYKFVAGKYESDHIRTGVWLNRRGQGSRDDEFRVLVNDTFMNDPRYNSQTDAYLSFWITTTILYELVHLGELKDGQRNGESFYRNAENNGLFYDGFTDEVVEQSGDNGYGTGAFGNYGSKPVESGVAFEMDIARNAVDMNTMNSALRYFHQKRKSYRRKLAREMKR